MKNVCINTKITAKKTKIYTGIELQVRLDCTGCGLVKGREKGVRNVSKRKATKTGKHVCIDTTGPYSTNPGATLYWVCAVYDFTDMS